MQVSAFWRKLTIIVGFLTAIANFGEDASAANPNKKSQSDQCRTDIMRVWPISWATKYTSLIPENKTTSASNQSNPSNYAEDGGHDDLNSYRQTIAAEKQAEFSEWQLWVSAIGTFVGALAAAFTGWAAIEAGRAANAALAAVGTERAWVMPNIVNPIQIMPIENSTWGGVLYEKSIGISFNFTNKGRSPAVDVLMIQDYRTINKTDHAIPIFNPIELTGDGGVFGPDSVFNAGLVPISQGDYLRLMNREIDIVLYSRIVYHDVFSRTKRTTEACFRIIYPGDRINNGVIEPNWMFGPAGKQNKIT